MRYLRDVQSVLTGLCAIFLVASLFPGLETAAYLACAFGSYFALKSAWESLRERSVDVNLLMVLAAIGAIAVGEPRDAAALLFLFSLSSTLESLAMARTKSAIEGLIKLRPDKAILVTAEGDRTVPVEELQSGDRVRVLPFESVPADGEVLEGQSEVNQAAMTGESVPVSKSVGEPLLAGTQNMGGMLVMSVSKPVGDSTLEKIVSLVQEAQENKASGERISQWFGERYTFLVLGAFAVSMVVRMLLGSAFADAAAASLTLLVALSPCALVISTPASTLSALTWAARRGILVRGGEFIERAGTIDALAVDKTGTLTTGKPQLVEICVCEELVPAGCRAGDVCWREGRGMSPEAREMLRYVAAAEQYSTHPVADAVVRRARSEGIDVPEATEQESLSGLGVRAVIDGHRVKVGQRRFFEHLPEHFADHADEFARKGLTVAVAEIEGRFAAFGFMDTPRSEASSFVREMHGLGVRRIAMLTGDTPATAQAVAAQVGVDEVHAGLMPADKTALIDDMVSQGHRLMMVGDGVNDAPSLARASVGVAMGGLGSDIALNAADVVLMQDRLERIPEFIRLGKRTRNIIRANLLFASGVIVALTIASLLGVLPLWMAVIGHEGSTVLVILNGLRLLGRNR